MSQLLEDIKEYRYLARKNQNHTLYRVYTTLLGEVMPSGNDTTTDEKVIKDIKSYLKNLSKCMEYETDVDSERYKALDTEYSVVTELLPKQMSEQQIHDLVVQYMQHIDPSEGGKAVGKIMGMLKQNHDGEYDPKVASSIVKNQLKV